MRCPTWSPVTQTPRHPEVAVNLSFWLDKKLGLTNDPEAQRLKAILDRMSGPPSTGN